MENETKTYYFAYNTEFGITIMAEEGESRKTAPPENTAFILFEDFGTEDIGPWAMVEHMRGLFTIPEEALDHLEAEMLMKASKLKLEAANLLQAVADFQELEKTNPKGE